MVRATYALAGSREPRTLVYCWRSTSRGRSHGLRTLEPGVEGSVQEPGEEGTVQETGLGGSLQEPGVEREECVVESARMTT